MCHIQTHSCLYWEYFVTCNASLLDINPSKNDIIYVSEIKIVLMLKVTLYEMFILYTFVNIQTCYVVINIY